MDELPLALELLPKSVTRLYLAFSGGVDSTALLHRLRKYSDHYKLVLWHINHGLQPNSAQMEDFTRCQAQRYQLEFRVDRLQLDASHGNLEARARQQRYGLFSARLTVADALLTAHHVNDQAETLLLNLLRGSGPAGLRAIAPSKPLGKGILLRPLINVTREEIEAYANHHGLQWIEDPSNQSERFDRNFLRHRVIPVLRQRWPAAVRQLHRACEWQNESYSLMQDLAEIDYQACRVASEFSDYACLDFDTWQGKSTARLKNLVRYWLHVHGKMMIGHNKMDQLLQQVQHREGSLPVIQGDGFSIRLYGQRLYLVDKSDQAVPIKAEYRVTADRNVDIPALGFSESRASILSRLGMADQGQTVSIRFRRGDDAVSNNYRHRLKRLYQRHRVPPWLRDSTPQIYLDDELVGLWLF